MSDDRIIYNASGIGRSIHTMSATDEATANRLSIPQQPQRQDSLTDQLRDLHIIAARIGCYDAADWLWKRIDTVANQGPSERASS